MKKIIAIVLCLGIFGVFALGSGSDEEPKQLSSENETGKETTKEEEKKNPSKDITIEEQVLLDKDGIKITAVSYEKDSWLSDSIKLLIENNSDVDMTIGCTALIVNDYMISDLFAADVAAGKKANESMSLSSSELKAAGIDAVGQVEIYFHAYTSDEWEDVFQNQYCCIRTSAYENMDTTVDDSGKELYNDKGIRIIGKTVDENSFWGSAILLYTENTSGKNISVSVEDFSINGFMIDPLFSTTVYDGKKSLDDITLLSSELEENGIETNEDIELKFHIYNNDTYDTIADSDVVKISVN